MTEDRRATERRRHDRQRRTFFVVVAVFATVVLIGASMLTLSQVNACERGNSLRDQINEQNLAFLAHNEITALAEGLRRERPQYEAIARFYRVLPQVNCLTATLDVGYDPPRPRHPTRGELRRVLDRLPEPAPHR